MDKINVLNISIDNLSTQELLHKLDLYGGILFTPNVDHMINLQKDEDFYYAYQKADYRVCDGQILRYTVKLILGESIKEKISGSDFFPAFCDYHKYNKNIKIFLLGAAPGVAKKAQENINNRVGQKLVEAAYSPSFGFEKTEKESLEIIELINNSGANVLAVGVGAPKQEKWIIKYKDKMPNIKIFMGIGATIDFEAGHKPRAPQWVSDAGLETLFRLFSEPKRLWRRYLINDPPIFLWLIKQKLNLYKNPF
ncbi:MAG: WecB/TagA/CpsF family glycosyltransferase [Microcoleaceae cyanobacterium]